MYFIQRGVVEVITSDGTVVTHLSEGAHFGEICLLTDDRRVASIKATTMCDLFSLSKQNFQELLEEFPEMRPFFETIAQKRLTTIGRLPEEESPKEACNYGSACCIRNRYSDTAKSSPATCRSLSTALAKEATATNTSSSEGASVEKRTSCKSLPSRRSETGASRLEPLRDEEYAQVNPHFVPHDEDS